ncbi:MAG: hypothetical protein ABJA37_03205 [Ferruginibacter sp.]
MKKYSFLTNKYVLSAIVLIGCLIADVILHKGMSRVIIPSAFTEKRQPQNFNTCNAKLINHSKHWLRAVGTVEAMQQLPAETNGFEWDVYFDNAENNFKIYDSLAVSGLAADTLLSIYAGRNLAASIWFNVKNLNASNSIAALTDLLQLRRRYALFNKIIVASDAPEYLNAYCDSGFFTGYNVPYFNPYKIQEDTLVHYIDIMAENLKRYPVNALSGSYFQYPVLKKYFPNFPILTWTDNSNISLINRVFNTHLKNEEQIKIVLYPFQ